MGDGAQRGVPGGEDAAGCIVHNLTPQPVFPFRRPFGCRYKGLVAPCAPALPALVSPPHPPLSGAPLGTPRPSSSVSWSTSALPRHCHTQPGPKPWGGPQRTGTPFHLVVLIHCRGMFLSPLSHCCLCRITPVPRSFPG